MDNKEETKKWLETKLIEYNESPEECILDLLAKTNNTIEQYIKQCSSIAAYKVMEQAHKHNKLFLEEVNNLKSTPNPFEFALDDDNKLVINEEGITQIAEGELISFHPKGDGNYNLYKKLYFPHVVFAKKEENET